MKLVLRPNADTTPNETQMTPGSRHRTISDHPERRLWRKTSAANRHKHSRQNEPDVRPIISFGIDEMALRTLSRMRGVTT